jgi:hypothetical protein
MATRAAICIGVNRAQGMTTLQAAAQGHGPGLECDAAGG